MNSSVMREKRTIWPIVLGIIAVVYALFPAVVFFLDPSPLYIWMYNKFIHRHPWTYAGAGSPLDEVTWRVSYLLILVRTILFLTAAISLMRRRFRSRIWIISACVSSIAIATICGLLLMITNLTATLYHADFRTQALMFLRSAIGGSLYPVLLLVWINRKTIRDEMALWKKSS